MCSSFYCSLFSSCPISSVIESNKVIYISFVQRLSFMSPSILALPLSFILLRTLLNGKFTFNCLLHIRDLQRNQVPSKYKQDVEESLLIFCTIVRCSMPLVRTDKDIWKDQKYVCGITKAEDIYQWEKNSVIHIFSQTTDMLQNVKPDKNKSIKLTQFSGFQLNIYKNHGRVGRLHLSKIKAFIYTVFIPT